MQQRPPCNALVAELGADTLRGGCAGDEAPRVVFPSVPGSRGEQLLCLLERAAAAGRSPHPARPVLLVEPDAHSPAQREALADVLFERLELPAVAVAKSSVLSALAFGHSGATVVDVGAGLTSVAPVHGCRVSAERLRGHAFAGRALDAAVLAALRGQGAEVGGAADGPGQQRALRVAQGLKETVCFCSHAPLAETGPAAPFVHRLPDGQQINVAAFSRSVPEALLVGDGHGFPGVPLLLAESLTASRCGLGAPHEVSDTVLLVGGTSLLVNFRERFEAALAGALPAELAARLRVKASAARRHSSWLGGSVAASCGAAASLWVSKADYEEHGAAILSARSLA